MKKILKSIYLALFKIRWRMNNRMNETRAVSNFALNNVTVGRNTYGNLFIQHYNKKAHLKIGAYCSIADHVTFLLGGEHDYRKITTYPFNSKLYHTTPRNSGRGGDITVGDDVWIGYGTIILSGVTIGTGSVIGAGSVVAKDVPPYSVFIGNRVIKKRFPDGIVNKLIDINWDSISHKKGDLYEQFVMDSIDESNVDEVLRCFRD